MGCVESVDFRKEDTYNHIPLAVRGKASLSGANVATRFAAAGVVKLATLRNLGRLGKVLRSHSLDQGSRGVRHANISGGNRNREGHGLGHARKVDAALRVLYPCAPPKVDGSVVSQEQLLW